MKINGITVKAEEFAYDGCHKIYLIEDEQDKHEAIECGYMLFPIDLLMPTYYNSCDLRFIYNWKLDTTYVLQFEEEVEFKI